MRRKIIFGIIIAFFVILFLYRMFQTIGKHKMSKVLSKEEQEFVYVVKTKLSEYKKIADSINFVGEVKGINEITVIPKVVGRVVKKVKQEGSFVKKDDIICEIDRDEPVLKYTTYELKSPIDGILVRYFVDIGAMVSQQTPVCLISDTQKVKVIFSIAENMVNKIKKNSYVKIETENNLTFVSKDLQLSNYIDPISRTMEVHVIIDNTDGVLKSGSFIRGELVFYEKFTVVVPQEAVLDIDSKNIVFVVKQDNTVEEREVKVGLRYKNFVEILSGVKEKERVVYQGGELLSNGMKVEVVE